MTAFSGCAAGVGKVAKVPAATGPVARAAPEVRRLPEVQQAQHAEPVDVSTDAVEVMPRSITDATPSGVTASGLWDLTQVLASVDRNNPRIGIAGERYREAYARLAAARALWLPSIRAGASFNKHEGTLQASNGGVADNSRTALNAGLGVQAIGAGSPIVPGVFANFHLRDAVFQPKIADHRAQATLEASRTVTNDLRLSAALAYLELLRAKQQLAITSETVANAETLVQTTGEFARVGQGLQADADRARTELAIRANDVLRAEEAIQTASAQLTELLSLDPSVTIEVAEETLIPLDLVDVAKEPGALIALGLSNRPELAEARHLVCETVHRYERERFAPLLPSVLLGVSYGGFGGSDHADIRNFRDRFDLDGVAFWELRNLGLGERAARDEASARLQQERLREVQLLDQVAREIMQAHAQVTIRQRQITQAEQAIQAATDSYQRNVSRIREGQGLPLETLQSLQALDQARREYLRVVADYNEAQFRLHRALGWPIE